jgi:hypothetical protein
MKIAENLMEEDKELPHQEAAAKKQRQVIEGK